MVDWKSIDLSSLFTLGTDPSLNCAGTSYESGVLFMMLAECFSYRSFLEIGTNAGYVSTLMGRYFELKGGGLVHTCDPEAVNSLGSERWEKATVQFFHMTSDDYFKQLRPDVKFDMIFIDGCRYPDFLWRDTANSIAHLSKFGTLVFHDPVTLPVVITHIYNSLRDFGRWDVIGFPYKTGLFVARRNEEEDWLALTDSLYPDHGYVMNTGWLDLKELAERCRRVARGELSW